MGSRNRLESCKRGPRAMALGLHFPRTLLKMRGQTSNRLKEHVREPGQVAERKTAPVIVVLHRQVGYTYYLVFHFINQCCTDSRA